MFRFVNVLINVIIANAVWEVAIYLGNDPIKVMLVYISAMIADVVYIIRNKD